MPKRKIIKIDEDKCTGCGLCVPSCAEGAIQIIDGKARLVKDSYCDGLGACLGECPEGALTIEERDTEDFDEEAAKKHVELKKAESETPVGSSCPSSGCPGSKMFNFAGFDSINENKSGDETGPMKFELRQWPVQMALVSPDAPYFKNADLLLAADCAPFCIPDFHNRFLKGKAVVVGCPKLDDVELYLEKLAQIITKSELKSITILHMEVPCCSGLIRLTKEAVRLSGKTVDVCEVTVGIRGNLTECKPV